MTAAHISSMVTVCRGGDGRLALKACFDDGLVLKATFLTTY